MFSQFNTVISGRSLFPDIYSPSTIPFSRKEQTKYLWGSLQLKHIPDYHRFCLICRVVSVPQKEEHEVHLNNDPQMIKCHEDTYKKDAIEALEEPLQVHAQTEIMEQIEIIKSMLMSLEDGEISIGAYDTAWVALVENIHGNGGPQFPLSLDWIANNQLVDGSWGDKSIFEAHDRLINTLACVIALKKWNIHPQKIEKGISFVRENLSKLENANAEHMLIGFEIAFPSLIEIARKLDIEIADDSPALQEIYAMRRLKLTKIPNDILHTVPTTLLHSIEGIPGLDWEKLLKLQSVDGSFLFSPSATAFALMRTKDQSCLRYLTRTVEKFNGGVPSVYPVDLFERIWAVDKLERLGISRYFSHEIKECIDYVDRYWTEDGICWARNSEVHDIDDTAMAFRLLRLHGCNVSAEVFQNFKKDGEFFCFAGQSNQAVTGIFNLYRASQVLFPGENILEGAKMFSSKFLREKQDRNELLDKWIIAKDLPGEVGYALEVPWYASFPRVEARFYVEQYGGEEDIWIGKTLYRMPYVSNNFYLELARLDYNNCQAQHQVEWNSIQKWYTESNLKENGMSHRGLLLAYFLAAANIFEPERWNERVAWVKTAVLVETIEAFFEKNGSSNDRRKTFINDFRYSWTQLGSVDEKQNKFIGDQGIGVAKTLLQTLNWFILDVEVAHGRDIGHHLLQAWENWMMRWEKEGDSHGMKAELLVRTIVLCSGRLTGDEQLSMPRHLYGTLFDITNKVCLHLCRAYQQRQTNKVSNCNESNAKAESEMQKLVELVVSSSSSGMDTHIKQIFLMIAKTYYYMAHISPATIDSHIAKVLFEKVI